VGRINWFGVLVLHQHGGGAGREKAVVLGGAGRQERASPEEKQGGLESMHRPLGGATGGGGEVLGDSGRCKRL
jgi:hypothetical protein